MFDELKEIYGLSKNRTTWLNLCRNTHAAILTKKNHSLTNYWNLDNSLNETFYKSAHCDLTRKKNTTLKRLCSNYGQTTATITDNPTIMSYDHKSDHPNFLSPFLTCTPHRFIPSPRLYIPSTINIWKKVLTKAIWSDKKWAGLLLNEIGI